jgi:hypothetical protein
MNKKLKVVVDLLFYIIRKEIIFKKKLLLHLNFAGSISNNKFFYFNKRNKQDGANKSHNPTFPTNRNKV